MAQNRNRIHFVGFKQKKELAEYYKAADVFALPTREDVWGLVVNEAMAYGLPVVTTDRCIAGLEMVKDGVNGKLVNVEDKKELSAAINECIDNYYKYSEGALKKAGEYTIEEMAKSHLKIWAGEMAHN